MATLRQKTGKKIQGKNLYVSFWDLDQNIRRALMGKRVKFPQVEPRPLFEMGKVVTDFRDSWGGPANHTVLGSTTYVRMSKANIKWKSEKSIYVSFREGEKKNTTTTYRSNSLLKQ